jgi:hypothetical protein
VRLTEEEYDVYWPWVKWLWNQQAVKLKNKTRWYRCKFSDRRKTIRGRKKASASNYYNCRCALKVVHKDWIGSEFSQTSTSLGHNHDIDSDLPPEVIDLGTHGRLEVMDGRTPTTISNNITNTRTVVQRPLDNILPLGRIGINGSGEAACPLTKIFNCAETFPHPYPAMMHARIHIGGDVPCPWADELNCSRIFRRVYECTAPCDRGPSTPNCLCLPFRWNHEVRSDVHLYSRNGAPSERGSPRPLTLPFW